MKAFNTKKILSVVTALGLCIAPLSANAAGDCAAKQAIENMLKAREIPGISELINCSEAGSCGISNLTENMRSVAEKLNGYIKCGDAIGISDCIKQFMNLGSNNGNNAEADDCTDGNCENTNDNCTDGSCEDTTDDCTDGSCNEEAAPDTESPSKPSQAPSIPDINWDEILDNIQSGNESASGGSSDTSTDDGTQSGTETPSDSDTDESTMPSGYAYEVISLVNQHRTAAGLEPLSYNNSALMAAAQKRAEEQQQVYSHTRPNGTSCFTVLDEYGVSYRGAGENIAMGQRTPAEVVEDWMNSEGHRENIMNPSFTHIGVGVHEAGGRYYWSQMFIA